MTKNTTRPFVVCFEHKLESKYNFNVLEIDDIKKFQAFLDKVSMMTFSQVDKSFGRKPDKEDTYKDKQVYHYEVSQSFRIHGVIDGDKFKVIRLDPHHKVHR